MDKKELNDLFNELNMSGVAIAKVVDFMSKQQDIIDRQQKEIEAYKESWTAMTNDLMKMHKQLYQRRVSAV